MSSTNMKSVQGAGALSLGDSVANEDDTSKVRCNSCRRMPIEHELDVGCKGQVNRWCVAARERWGWTLRTSREVDTKANETTNNNLALFCSSGANEASKSDMPSLQQLSVFLSAQKNDSSMAAIPIFLRTVALTPLLHSVCREGKCGNWTWRIPCSSEFFSPPFLSSPTEFMSAERNCSSE